MMGNLFNKWSLSAYVADKNEQLRNEVSKLSVAYSDNTDDLQKKLIEKYTIEPLNLYEPNPSEPREIILERKNMFNETIKTKAFEISVIIPFNGEKDLFYCMPSHSTVIYLEKGVTIGHSKITAKIVLDKLDDQKYKNKLKKIISDLSTNIPRVNSEINPWNQNIESKVIELIEERKKISSAKENFMNKIKS